MLAPIIGGNFFKWMEQILVFVNIEPIIVQINVQMMESMAIIETFKEVNLNYIELTRFDNSN